MNTAIRPFSSNRKKHTKKGLPLDNFYLYISQEEKYLVDVLRTSKFCGTQSHRRTILPTSKYASSNLS